MKERSASWRDYAVCVGSVALATAIDLVLSRLAGRPTHTFIVFCPAILVTAMFCGREAGLLSVGLSAVAGAFLVEPFGTLGIEHLWDAFALVIFVIVGVFIVLICQRMHHALRAAERASREARQSEQRMRLVADGLPALIAYVDHDLRYRFVSRAYERWFGITRKQILGQHHPDFAPDREAYDLQVRPHVNAALAGKPVHFQSRLRYWDGITRDVDVTYAPDIDAEGKVRGFASLVLDITQVKRVEEQFRIAQELAPSGFVMLRAVRSEAGAPISDFVVEYINPAGIRMGKYGDAANVIGHPLSEVSPASMKESKLFGMYCRAVEENHAHDVELRFESDRAAGWFHVQTVPMGGDRIAISYSDITAQRELLASERAARSEAERASRLKDEFLATLSHELRTPLNAILGWAQLLHPEKSDKEDLHVGITTIERNARVQKQIIEDLLDMSRIIAGKIRIDVQRVDPVLVVDAAIGSVRPAAEAKGIRLVKVLDPLAGQVNADAGRLQQVVWNLLTNAIKFTPRRGEVRVTLARVDSQLRISVCDDGQGIKAEFLPYIFERFRQQDPSTTRRHGGLGLGLSIVKQLVELHGGTVHADSAGEGKGARFTVDLPLVDVPTDGRVVREPFDRKHSDSHNEAALLNGLKLLVVDDEADARELVGRILRECGAEVSTASSTDEALQLLLRHRPDVLLSDIGMPDRDGYDLIREVRSLPSDRGGGTPAVALTAFARSEDRTRSLLAGYQVHVSKPIERRELVATIASLAGFVARE